MSGFSVPRHHKARPNRCCGTRPTARSRPNRLLHLFITATDRHDAGGRGRPLAVPTAVPGTRCMALARRVVITPDRAGIGVIVTTTFGFSVTPANRHLAFYCGGPVAIPAFVPMTGVRALALGVTVTPDRAGTDVERISSADKCGKKNDCANGDGSITFHEISLPVVVYIQFDTPF